MIAMNSKYMQDLIQRVKENFKDHEVQVIQTDVDDYRVMWLIEWRQPGSSIYAIRYIVFGNSMFVKGDCGEAIYSVYESQHPTFWASTDLAYLRSKCKASPGGLGHDWAAWNGDVCTESVHNFVQEFYKDEGKEPDAALLEECLDNVHLQQDFIHWAYTDGSKFFDDFPNDWDPHTWGHVYPIELVAHWVGIRMAWEAYTRKQAAPAQA